MATKTFMLAVVTALSLGANSAMAQSEVPGGAQRPNDAQQRHAPPQTVTDWSTPGQVQSGSPDMDAPRSNHVPSFNGDFGDLANPG
jgi:hypothetical protein